MYTVCQVRVWLRCVENVWAYIKHKLVWKTHFEAAISRDSSDLESLIVKIRRQFSQKYALKMPGNY